MLDFLTYYYLDPCPVSFLYNLNPTTRYARLYNLYAVITAQPRSMQSYYKLCITSTREMSDKCETGEVREVKLKGDVKEVMSKRVLLER